MHAFMWLLCVVGLWFTGRFSISSYTSNLCTCSLKFILTCSGKRTTIAFQIKMWIDLWVPELCFTCVWWMITSNDFTMQATESRIFVLVAGPTFARTILCEVSWVNITTAYVVYHGKQGINCCCAQVNVRIPLNRYSWKLWKARSWPTIISSMDVHHNYYISVLKTQFFLHMRL